MPELITLQARRVNVKGVVQGVGFRPFVYQLAIEHGLKGWVRNTSGDVTIVVEGESRRIEQFLHGLRETPPPQARIESIAVAEEPANGYHIFEIRESLTSSHQYQLVSPDLAICPACKAEIFYPTNRRYRYPFTNCTNCGPRFTIIEDIPYDRERTTMRAFKMCPDCQKEYDDPADRRFHAQPNACPVCGPRLELADSAGQIIPTADVIARSAQLLKEGFILAIKGLGGFLLACDATSDKTVGLLRQRKRRPAKPFAVMVKDIADVTKYGGLSEREKDLLTSPASPIVLLKRKGRSSISPEIAPGLGFVGMMLPYTPLHHLLMNEVGTPLVMTSGNLSEEPIARDNAEAVDRLHGIADYFVLHNRDIYSRYDDSVVTVMRGRTQVVRRARGFAPYPIQLPFQSRPVLACGPELKNTFCLTRDNHAFVSQHIGDMENEETLEHFENTVRLYESLFRIRPEIIACDLHPDYLSTNWAAVESSRSSLPLIPIQHHHAHIVSCLAENGIQGPVIGVAFDGTGFGTDGCVWGGEFVIADYQSFQRKAHFEYLPLPGGAVAIRKPYRTARGYLYALFGPEVLKMDLPCLKGWDELEIELVQKQIDLCLNMPLTSSCGRLFDAVSSLLGIRQEVEYEGQAAVELEMAAGKGLTRGQYGFQLEVKDGVRIIKLKEMFAGIIADFQQAVPIATIAALFHNTVAQITIGICLELSRETGLRQVALSGGVFQNRRLFNQVYRGLRSAGLVPLVHRLVPCNDGGISLGQAIVANFSHRK
jgi:hydrogenase maturation protein HypF